MNSHRSSSRLNMNTTFEEISSLITQISLYNKSIETYDSIPSIDQTIFTQLENHLSKLTIKKDELSSTEFDCLILFLFFLLEHIPLEIDLNLLTSTETNYHQIFASTRKIYKLNLITKQENRHKFSSQSQIILKHFFEYLQIKNLEEFLQLKQNSQPIYQHCFHLLTPLLLKTTYNQYPIAIELFVHIIKSLNQISITESFDLIFSVCLITLDDPSIDMKLISLYLLDYLQKYCTSTELLLFNRANVIMYGLEQNLHRRSDPMPFFECLLATTYRWLIILENETYSGKHLFIRTSQLIERLIRDAILETNIEYRRCLLKILRYYINRLQLFAIRHLNHFLELIDDSLDNRSLRNDALQILLTILQTLKPRINAHRLDIMKIIIRCLFRMYHEEQENLSMIQLVKKCLQEFQLSTTENYVQDAIQSLIGITELDSSYREFLQKFL